jgi:hypothetical protein
VQVKLRLDAGDALALQVAARANGRTISAHVAVLLATAGDPRASQRSVERVDTAIELTQAVRVLPRDVRRLQGELARQGGLVKSLFTRPETVRDAEAHSRECAAALNGLLDASARASAAATAIEAELAEVREDLRTGVREMFGRGA